MTGGFSILLIVLWQFEIGIRGMMMEKDSLALMTKNTSKKYQIIRKLIQYNLKIQHQNCQKI